MPDDLLENFNCGTEIDATEAMADSSDEPDDALRTEIALSQLRFLAVIASSLQRIAESLESIRREGIPNDN